MDVIGEGGAHWWPGKMEEGTAILGIDDEQPDYPC